MSLRRMGGRNIASLDDAMADDGANTLETGYGIYGEWSASTLGIWMDQQWTVDRLTLAGQHKDNTR